MHETPHDFNFLATGIGSVPFLDIEATCQQIVEFLPRCPFWPQFVRRSPLEDMSIQFSGGLPLIEIEQNARSLAISRDQEREHALADFYAKFLSTDIEYFKITSDFAPGLYSLLEYLNGMRESTTGPFIKGQSVGPVTFAAGILGLDGKPILHDPELSEAMANGLAIKALWQVRTLSQTGMRPILFFDEPYLSGFGSAFSPLGRSEVIDLLRIPMDYLRKHSDVIIGVHCCGNTDWSMILEAGPDVVNFDAFEFMDHFLLYPDEVKRFVENGGSIAWGIVPTASFRGDETGDRLSGILKRGIESLEKWGVSRGLVSQRSILTPACGMGTMDPNSAEAAIELLSSLASYFSS
ncbi:MAG: hypothetical protein P8165_03185 [Deltaproteobacteria bacterium]|jgi:methionine synthase II (cobalamin-independent)